MGSQLISTLSPSLKGSQVGKSTLDTPSAVDDNADPDVSNRPSNKQASTDRSLQFYLNVSIKLSQANLIGTRSTSTISVSSSSSVRCSAPEHSSFLMILI